MAKGKGKRKEERGRKRGRERERKKGGEEKGRIGQQVNNAMWKEEGSRRGEGGRGNKNIWKLEGKGREGTGDPEGDK